MIQKLVQSIFSDDQAATMSAGLLAMEEEKKRVGGLFHFNIHKDEKGWSAQCVEIDAIITGGKSPDPKKEEIEGNIRQAIQTAFNITHKEKGERMIQNVTDTQAVYTFSESPKLSVV